MYVCTVIAPVLYCIVLAMLATLTHQHTTKPHTTNHTSPYAGEEGKKQKMRLDQRASFSRFSKAWGNGNGNGNRGINTYHRKIYTHTHTYIRTVQYSIYTYI